MKRILILLSVVGLLLGACGDGDDDSASSNTTASETASGTADDSGDDSGSGGKDGELKAKLLVASDLPDGFELTDSEERDPADNDAEDDSAPCAEFNEIDKKYPGEREAEANFQREGADGASAVFVNEQIVRFADEEEAEAAFDLFEEVIDKCGEFSDTDDDGTETSGAFKAAAFPDTGDDTYAATITLSQKASSGEAAELDGNFVAMRTGEYIVLVFELGLGDELTDDELEAVAERAVEKV